MTDLKSRSFRLVRRFLADRQGATAIEYAMIAAGIALAIVASITALGATVDGLFSSVLAALR